MKPRTFVTVLGTAAGLMAFTTFAVAASGNGQSGPARGVPQVTEASDAVASSSALSARNAFTAANPGAHVKNDGEQISRVFGKAFSHGATPTDSAEAFLSQHAAMFGVAAADLAPIGPFVDGEHLVQIMPDRVNGGFKFTGVYYTQTFQGIPVFRSHLCVLVRNEAGFPAVEASSTLWDSTGMAEALAGRNLQQLPSASVYTRKAFNSFRSQPQMSPAQLVIYAGTERQHVQPRLAVTFEAEAGSSMDPDTHQRILFVVDADNGDILYQENRIYHAVTGQVTGMATQNNAAGVCAPEVATPLPYIEVTKGATIYYADVNGNFSIPGGAAATFSTRLAGQFFTVSNNGSAPLSLSTSAADGAVWNPLLNASNSSEADLAQVNAYLHANIVRDMVLEASPSYPTVSTQSSTFPVTVNIASTCNAYYSGSTINFYASGGGCNNLAYGDVVHHEYGHNVVEKGGSGQGAYGEGFGDICALIITDNPVMAPGFQSCASGIRTADNTCQYNASSCSSCGSEVHACGQLISGCVWDLRDQFVLTYPADYSQRIADLAINSIMLHGAVSSITADITVDFLTLDDNDSDITNGTPNYTAIATAFGSHGLPAPALSPLTFSFPDGMLTIARPDGTSSMRVNVAPLSGAPAAGSGKAFVKGPSAGSFVEVPMASTGPNSYVFTVPAGTCGGGTQFYFMATSTDGFTQTSPATAPTAVYNVPLAYDSADMVSDTFETASGWTAGAAGDTATTGIWVRADPVGTSAQPENDHTPAPGTLCWITGNGPAGGTVGAADVDGGVTTLVSPTYNLAAEGVVYVSYWRWYSNDQGSAPNADVFPIEVSNNNGTSWVTLENVTENANAWVNRTFRLNDYITLTSQVKFRFKAQDLASGSVIEAGIDDFKLTSYGCEAPLTGDLNGDGVVDGTDLGLLLGNWGLPGTSDLNNDGTTDGTDLGLLLGAWG